MTYFSNTSSPEIARRGTARNAMRRIGALNIKNKLPENTQLKPFENVIISKQRNKKKKKERINEFYKIKPVNPKTEPLVALIIFSTKSLPISPGNKKIRPTHAMKINQVTIFKPHFSDDTRKDGFLT